MVRDRQTNSNATIIGYRIGTNRKCEGGIPTERRHGKPENRRRNFLYDAAGQFSSLYVTYIGMYTGSNVLVCRLGRCSVPEGQGANVMQFWIKIEHGRWRTTNDKCGCPFGSALHVSDRVGWIVEDGEAWPWSNAARENGNVLYPLTARRVCLYAA